MELYFIIGKETYFLKTNHIKQYKCKVQHSLRPFPYCEKPCTFLQELGSKLGKDSPPLNYIKQMILQLHKKSPITVQPVAWLLVQTSQGKNTQTFWNHILKSLQLNQPFFFLCNLNSILFSILENSRDAICRTQCQEVNT